MVTSYVYGHGFYCDCRSVKKSQATDGYRDSENLPFLYRRIRENRLSEFYDQDLAYVHHVGFGDFARNAGEQLCGILRDHGIDSGLIVDLGCGSGIWAARLLQAGYQVVGVDVSPHMVALAQNNAMSAHVQQSSVYDFKIPHCRAITALGEVLCYGTEGLPSDKQVADFFSRAADSLPVGGLLIFDVIADATNDSMDYKAWRKGADWAVLVDSKEDHERNQLTREITVFREVNGHYRCTEERHQVRIFSIDSVKQLLKAAGFAVSASNCYGDYQLATRRQAFIAIK